jgi:glycosyltransferase involved in cell wall biosynthesis
MIEKQVYNILFISHYSSMYGANKSLCTLMLELRENYEINPVVLLPNHGPICEYLDKNSIKYIISHFYWWVYYKDGAIERILNYRKQVRNLLRIVKIFKTISHENINLVYTNSITINIGAFLSKMLGCPHIWHIRESMEHYYFKFSVGNFFAKKIFRKGADSYILISDFLIRSYNKYLPNKITQKIYNGVSINIKKRDLNQLFGVMNICIVGVVCEQKNQFDAVKTIKILVKDKGVKNVKLHIVGVGKGEYVQKLQEYIRKYDLLNYVVFYDHQHNINQLLSKMNLGLVCARDEAFGRVTIEYMLNRLPVIASRSGANTELVKDGVNGDVYELYESTELANKIQHYIQNPNLLEEIGGSAYEYAISNFSSKKNSDSIYNVIEKLIVEKYGQLPISKVSINPARG